MLLLKPLSEDRGRSLVPMSQLLLSLRLQGYASQTCTHVRLLGPCFKTGRIEPFCQLLATHAEKLADHVREDRRSGRPRTQKVRPTCTRSTSSVNARITRPRSGPPQGNIRIDRLNSENSLVLASVKRFTTCVRVWLTYSACATGRQPSPSTQQPFHQIWFHPLPIQRFQALVTLFSKSFSRFPHGTCFLSVSNEILSLRRNLPPT
jgi:hypothetical protein